MLPLGKKLIIKPQKDEPSGSVSNKFVVVNKDSDVQRGEVIAVSTEIEKIKSGQIVVYYTGRYPKIDGNEIVDEDSVVGIVTE